MRPPFSQPLHMLTAELLLPLLWLNCLILLYRFKLMLRKMSGLFHQLVRYHG